MRLNEIDDVDKSALRLKGITYDFSNYIDFILSSIDIVGKSLHRRNMLKNTIELRLEEIKIFLNEGFPDNDIDVINAKNIYIKLQDIRNKL